MSHFPPDPLPPERVAELRAFFQRSSEDEILDLLQEMSDAELAHVRKHFGIRDCREAECHWLKRRRKKWEKQHRTQEEEIVREWLEAGELLSLTEERLEDLNPAAFICLEPCPCISRQVNLKDQKLLPFGAHHFLARTKEKNPQPPKDGCPKGKIKLYEDRANNGEDKWTEDYVDDPRQYKEVTINTPDGPEVRYVPQDKNDEELEYERLTGPGGKTMTARLRQVPAQPGVIVRPPAQIVSNGWAMNLPADFMAWPFERRRDYLQRDWERTMAREEARWNEEDQDD